MLTISKLVEMKNISKSFFGVEILHNVGFEIDSREVVALCGENGAGKSTLMIEIAKVISFNVKAMIMDESTSMLTTRENINLIDQIKNKGFYNHTASRCTKA